MSQGSPSKKVKKLVLETKAHRSQGRDTRNSERLLGDPARAPAVSQPLLCAGYCPRSRNNMVSGPATHSF